MVEATRGSLRIRCDGVFPHANATQDRSTARSIVSKVRRIEVRRTRVRNRARTVLGTKMRRRELPERTRRVGVWEEFSLSLFELPIITLQQRGRLHVTRRGHAACRARVSAQLDELIRT